jgi:hypothetical protein
MQLTEQQETGGCLIQSAVVFGIVWLALTKGIIFCTGALAVGCLIIGLLMLTTS